MGPRGCGQGVWQWGGGGSAARGPPPTGPSAAVPQPPSLYLFLGPHGAGAPQHDSRSLEPPLEMRGGWAAAGALPSDVLGHAVVVPWALRQLRAGSRSFRRNIAVSGPGYRCALVRGVCVCAGVCVGGTEVGPVPCLITG